MVYTNAGKDLHKPNDSKIGKIGVWATPLVIISWNSLLSSKHPPHDISTEKKLSRITDFTLHDEFDEASMRMNRIYELRAKSLKISEPWCKRWSLSIPSSYNSQTSRYCFGLMKYLNRNNSLCLCHYIIQVLSCWTSREREIIYSNSDSANSALSPNKWAIYVTPNHKTRFSTRKAMTVGQCER